MARLTSRRARSSSPPGRNLFSLTVPCTLHFPLRDAAAAAPAVGARARSLVVAGLRDAQRLAAVAAHIAHGHRAPPAAAQAGPAGVVLIVLAAEQAARALARIARAQPQHGKEEQ